MNMTAPAETKEDDKCTNNVPKTFVDALDFDDPYEALMALSRKSQEKATELSDKLISDISEHHSLENSNNSSNLPDLLKRLPNTKDADSHPVAMAIACSDSILHSLTKIASGGSQASQEIIQLEQEKRELEQNAADVETALRLRKASDVAAQSLSAQRVAQASAAIQEYGMLLKKHKLTARAKVYAGEYTVTQLESSKKALRATLLKDYQQAVKNSDLQSLGKLTPMLQMVQYEKEAVTLYLRFLKEILEKELDKVATSNTLNNPTNKQQTSNSPTPPYILMGKVYNVAVTILRHHLPMVSHCLYRADGDAAVVQLINVQVENSILPLFEKYISSRQLDRSARNSQHIYGVLESRLASEAVEGGGTVGSALGGIDDGGFATDVGSLSDVDASMEEAVLCLQHAESYTRFIQHTVREVNKARELRYQTEQEERRVEKEQKEWSTGMKQTDNDEKENDGNNDDDQSIDREKDYVPLDILPVHTNLQEKITEVGGYYSAIESCLLIASMQRALAIQSDDPRQYSSLATVRTSKTNNPLKTSIVESSLYAARRGAQRAFATGHSNTASAVTNYFADCLRDVLVQCLSRRAEELGVNPLKPGDGLLEGSASIFGTTGLVITGRQSQQGANAIEEKQRQHKIQQGISFACASLNDLEVAAHHTKELQRILSKSVDTGFPPKTQETEQLRMCIKSFGPVAETFIVASDQAVECLISLLKPRIRSIVTESVGSDHGIHKGTSSFSSVIGTGGTSADRHTVRMNYELDEDAYQLLEVSESYVSRLCTLLDEIIVPLCQNLSPRLADNLVLGVLATVSKRLEVSFKKVRSLIEAQTLLESLFCSIL